jgi:hypothetical protein
VHAFHSLAYLDVEKSGSTFVSQFLCDFLDDDEVSFRKHVEMEDRPPAGRVHVISVRDPLDTYLSLYSYGCQGKGGLAGTMRDAGLGHLYDGTAGGFDRWLDAVLDPAEAMALNPSSYGRSGVAPHVGLLSFRVARLSTPRPLRWICAVTSTEDFLRTYRQRTVVDVVLRNESLTQDLAALVRREDLAWRPSREAALSALAAAERLNTSTRLDSDAAFEVPGDAWQRVAAREPLLTEVFGYADQRTSTRPAIQAVSAV